jgi:hypothetical protein
MAPIALAPVRKMIAEKIASRISLLFLIAILYNAAQCYNPRRFVE